MSCYLSWVRIVAGLINNYSKFITVEILAGNNVVKPRITLVKMSIGRPYIQRVYRQSLII